MQVMAIYILQYYLIKEIKQIFENYSFKTQILVASVRHPQHVIDAAKIGADVVTLPPAP